MINYIQKSKQKLKEAKDIIENNKSLGYVTYITLFISVNLSFISLLFFMYGFDVLFCDLHLHLRFDVSLQLVK